MAATLRLNTALYGSAILFDRLLGLLLLPLLAGAMSRADYGAWTQTAITAGMLVPLVLFAFPTTIVRSFSGAAALTWRWRAFIRLGGVAAVLFVLCAALALAWRGPAATLVYGDVGSQALLVPLLGLLAADAGIEFAISWLRVLGRMGRVAAVLALRSALRYAVVLLLIEPAGHVLADWLGQYVAVQCGAAALVVAMTAQLLRASAASAEAHAAAPRLAGLLAFSTPLVLLALFTALNAFVDRFVLVRTFGLDEVAVYAAAASLCGIPAVFYSVLGFTVFPALARHWNEQRRPEVARLTSEAMQVFLFLCLPVSLLIALVGPRLLPLLTSAEYHAPAGVFLLLGASVATFGLYQIALYALLLDGRSRDVLLLAIVAAALNLGLNLALVPRLGALGAAGSVAASNLMMVTVAARLARTCMPWRFPWARLWALAWRAGVAALPLAWAVQPGPAPASWPLLTTMCVASAVLYFVLEWTHPSSVTRLMLERRHGT